MQKKFQALVTTYFYELVVIEPDVTFALIGIVGIVLAISHRT
jgi:hypothetical protein